jgi:hypothetical protein
MSELIPIQALESAIDRAMTALVGTANRFFLLPIDNGDGFVTVLTVGLSLQSGFEVFMQVPEGDYRRACRIVRNIGNSIEVALTKSFKDCGEPFAIAPVVLQQAHSSEHAIVKAVHNAGLLRPVIFLDVIPMGENETVKQAQLRTCLGEQPGAAFIPARTSRDTWFHSLRQLAVGSNFYSGLPGSLVTIR